ncbi:MAG: type III-B CRISPR-associated protein Cas10/Cmr2 [Bacteroidota bacterium]
MPTYHALTLGPVVETITAARRTRELWAASFFFSLLMRKIIGKLPPGSHKHILLPALDPDRIDKPNDIAEQLSTKVYGAGVWPDRLIVVDPPVDINFVDIADQALQTIATQIKIDDWKELRDSLRIRRLKAIWTEAELLESAVDKAEPEEDRKDHLAVHRINRLLANLEYRLNYRSSPNSELIDLLSQPKTVHALYDIGFNKTEPGVFELMDDNSIRIPSLPELGLTDLRKYKEAYQKAIKNPIDERVMEVRRQERDAKYYFKEREEEKLYVDLKKLLRNKIAEDGNMPLVLRHKYIAVVVADGDSIGTEVSRVSQEGPEAIRQFSRKLAAFSKASVQKIVDFQGLPIYAGGDDLFFVAPVVNTGSSTHNVIQLCHELDREFAKAFGEGGPTLSFGVSISYYKFPLGEAVSRAYELEKDAKNFILRPSERKKRKKNAICFEVRKHSGQQFGATLPLRLKNQDDETLFDQVAKVLNPKDEAADSFLTSFMHKAQSLSGLLASALKDERSEAFRRHHYNEGGNHDRQYIKDALKLGEKIFATHGSSLDSKPDADDDMHRKTLRKMRQTLGLNYEEYCIEAVDFHHVDLLFSLLRFKQFTVQPDHD